MFGKQNHRKVPLTLLLILLVAATGCETDSPADPQPAVNEATAAPVLPDPVRLSFDFGFFDRGESLEKAGDKSHANFVNAYLRAVLLEAMAHLVLAPPVTAFSLALHTPPSLQDDGSWIWVYTFVDGDEEAQIRLRGVVVGASVEWELWVTAPAAEPPLDDALWFSGNTADDGEVGHWIFYNLADAAQPVCGEIAWGRGPGGEFLRFTSREPGAEGDALTFTDSHPQYAITFQAADETSEWFIRWHADGTGSLRVPDYRGGNEACWDDDQRDVACD